MSLAANLGLSANGHRAFVGAVKDVIRPESKKLDPLGKALVLSASCDAIWTRVRAREAGYSIPSILCELCGLAEDTLDHRICGCTAEKVVEARAAACPPWFLRLMGDGSEDPIKLTKGIILHPAHLVPAPSSDKGCRFMDADGNDLASLVGFGGEVFIDGSCTQHKVHELRRASWSVRAVDDQGLSKDMVIGPVWAPLPQTPQAAEFCALAAVAQVLTERARIYGDCWGVVKLANAPLRCQLSPKVLYAGAFRDMMSLPQAQLIDSVEWVKAHILDTLSEDQMNELPENDLWKAKGNQLADVAAKQALSCHPQLPKDIMDVVDKELNMAYIALQVMAAVLRLWPKLPRGMPRTPLGTKVGRKPAIKEPDWHIWSDPSLGWMHCTMCWASMMEGAEQFQGRNAVECPGSPPMLEHLGAGHDLWLYECASGNLVVCRTCGLWGTKKILELRNDCLKRSTTTGRKRVIDRVALSKHPSDSARLKDIKLGNGRKHTYCVLSEGFWLATFGLANF